jgi:hypothetical protein
MSTATETWMTPKRGVETRRVEARVVAVLPEYHQAELETADGHRYALTEHTPGIRLSEVKKDQQWRCLVTVRLPRVLQAELINKPNR